MRAVNRKSICITDLEFHNRMLNRAATKGNITALYDMFKNLESPNLKSYSIMIKGLTVAKDVKGAFAMYEQMKNAGIRPNQIVYTTLIKACLSNRQVDRAWKTWDFMRSHISEPDYKSYSLMIHACTYSGDVEKAFGLFDEMVRFVF
jgi:pentatricopeptide repeat protein